MGGKLLYASKSDAKRIVMPSDVITSADRGGTSRLGEAAAVRRRSKARRTSAMSALTILAIGSSCGSGGGCRKASAFSPPGTHGRTSSFAHRAIISIGPSSAALHRQPLTALDVAQSTEELTKAAASSKFLDDLAAKVRFPDDDDKVADAFGMQRVSHGIKQEEGERNGKHEQAVLDHANAAEFLDTLEPPAATATLSADHTDAVPPPSAADDLIVPSSAALVLETDLDETGDEIAAVEGPQQQPHLPSDLANPLPAKLFNALLLSLSFGFALYTILTIDSGMTRGWTPSEITMRIPLDTWSSYENSLSAKPVATKTIINVVIYLLGDWLSQTVFQKKDVLDFDAVRTLRNGFIGLCFGPLVHEYYEFSDLILPVDVGINRIYKIFMDQTLYLYVKCSIYIIAVGVLSGVSFKESKDNAQERIGGIMFTAWKFWPLVHCVTYGLIPARHRILWVNSVDLIWNAILAGKTSNNEEEEVVVVEEEMLALEGANGVVGLEGEDAAQITVVMASEGDLNGVEKDDANHRRLELADDDTFEDAAEGGLARQKVLNGTAPFVE